MQPKQVLVLMTVLLVCGATLEAVIGPLGIALGRILPATWAFLHGSTGTDALVMGDIRLPRLVVAILVGMGLASTGAVLQALLRNPMADPAVIGVSSGGSLGAVAAIQLGLSQHGLWLTPMSAFAGSLAVVFVIYRLSTARGSTSLYSLLLAGVAIGTLCGALVSLLLSLAPLGTMQQMLFWLMGGLSGSTWKEVCMLLVFVMGGIAIYWLQSPALDVLSIGEEHAQGVGVRLQAVKQILFTTSALVVGACVSTTGVIGFVGLIVPHLLRLWVGPGHRWLIVLSALGGAILLTFSDVLARLVLMPVEINIGIVTSCLVVPFFLYLLRRRDAAARWGTAP